MPPPKRVPQTDAIFERLSEVNPQADDIRATACTAPPEPDGEPRSQDLPTRQTPEWQAEYALRRAYNALFPEFLAAVAL